MVNLLPGAIQKAFAINPAVGGTFLDRSFDHCFGALQGVRGFNDRPLDGRYGVVFQNKAVFLQKNNSNWELYWI